MTGEIMDEILTLLNRKMKCMKRFVLLMDNEGCHPPELSKDHYSKIKIVFLPANTTSKLH